MTKKKKNKFVEFMKKFSIVKWTPDGVKLKWAVKFKKNF